MTGTAIAMNKPKIRRETGDYQRPQCLEYAARGTKYSNMQNTLSSSWSDAFGSAFGGYSGPQLEVDSEGASLSLPSTSQLSLRPEDEMAPSSSMGTNPEVLLEQLDEKGTKAVLRAITHKFEITDPADRESTSKVNQYLRAVLEKKQQTSFKLKDYSTQWGNLSY